MSCRNPEFGVYQMLMFFQHHAALAATIKHAKEHKDDNLSSDMATSGHVALEYKMETKIQAIETRAKQNSKQVFDDII